MPAATLPHAISALAASYTQTRQKSIFFPPADLPRFAVRGRVFRLDFRVNFGNDFACNSLLFLLHHGRSYIYDLLIILFPYRAERPCMEASSGRWDSGRFVPNPSTGVPFPGACPATKGPACSMRSCQRSSERSGTSRMSDFVPGVRWDGAAPAELPHGGCLVGRERAGATSPAPSIVSVPNKHTIRGDGVATHVLEVAFPAPLGRRESGARKRRVIRRPRKRQNDPT